MNTEEIYTGRINKVIDYIEDNLGRPFDLTTLAGEACFSPYHFHRIFTAITGESLFEFIGRLRVEKAAQMLLSDRERSISDVLFRCGFNSSQDFSRKFRKHFGLSPSKWRSSPGSSLPGLAFPELKGEEEFRFLLEEGKPTWECPAGRVQVLRRPEKRVAYYRYVGPYKGDSNLFARLWETLMKWAGPRELITKESEFMAIYHDSMGITAEDKLRTSICLTVDEGVQGDGVIGTMEIPGGLYGVSRFRLAGEEYSKAWNWLYSSWLPQSGYQPDDRSSFEYYPCSKRTEPEDGRVTVDLCIPVKPL